MISRPFSLTAAAALLCAAFALPLQAAPAAPANFVPISPAQAKALGVVSQPLAPAGQGQIASLPAKVVVPVEQLRVVAAPLAGLVTQVAVVAGQSVKKGQVLARLSSPGLLQIQRDYLQARQQADLMGRNARRDEQLYQEGIIAQSRYQATRAGQKEAEVAAAALGEELRLAGAAGGKHGITPEVAIVAPLAGEVLDAPAAIGTRVDMAAPLFTVGRLSPLWLEIQVPAALAAQVREGQPVQVVRSPARGRIINVGRQIAGTSQTVTLRARLDQGTDSLRPGQLVEAAVGAAPGAAPVGQASFLVPQGALVREGGKTYLFVAVAKGYQAWPVRVLGTTGNGALVAGPRLTGGLRVAVKGLSSLKSAWTGAAAEGE